MPYIEKERRKAILAGEAPATAGELNFLLTMSALRYLALRGISYATLNDILGALDAAAREFYRRVIAPYEREKCIENGDVYP